MLQNIFEYFTFEIMQGCTPKITDAISIDNQCFALDTQSITSSLQTPLSMTPTSNLTAHRIVHVLRPECTKPGSTTLFYI